MREKSGKESRMGLERVVQKISRGTIRNLRRGEEG